MVFRTILILISLLLSSIIVSAEIVSSNEKFALNNQTEETANFEIEDEDEFSLLDFDGLIFSRNLNSRSYNSFLFLSTARQKDLVYSKPAFQILYCRLKLFDTVWQ